MAGRQPERDHADERARGVDQRRAPEGRVVRRDEDGAIQQVLPVARRTAPRSSRGPGRRPPGRWRPCRRSPPAGRPRAPRTAPAARRDTARRPDRDGSARARSRSRARRPAPSRVRPSPSVDVDPRGVENEVAHGHREPVGIDDRRRAAALLAERGRRGPIGRDQGLEAHDRVADARHGRRRRRRRRPAPGAAPTAGGGPRRRPRRARGPSATPPTRGGARRGASRRHRARPGERRVPA